MYKQTHFIITALVAFCVSYVLNSCNTEEPNNNVPIIAPLDKSSGCLNGAFAIGENKYVYFSQGNLQYTQNTDTWSFAEQQYEFLGEINLNNSNLFSDNEKGLTYSGDKLGNKIDLFGRSGSTGSAKWGVSTSIYHSDYSGDFVDWGKNPIKNGGNKPNLWRTLTYDEWFYLRWKRTDYDKLIGVAQVAGVNGLILLPDNWTLPTGLSFKSGFADERIISSYGKYQSYTQQEWSQMESAGAVFLPASGYRSIAYLTGVVYITDIGYQGGYWSSSTTTNGDLMSYYNCNPDFVDLNGGTYVSGYSVRLVQDVK